MNVLIGLATLIVAINGLSDQAAWTEFKNIKMKVLILLAALIIAINGLSDQLAWKDFKTKHSRRYQLVEDKYRFQVFQENLRKIEAHNVRYENGEVSYFLKVTKFADWTEEEFKSLLKRQTSSKPNNDDLEYFKPDPSFKAPDSIDWRDQNVVSPVKNQGDCGSCWAFSVTGTIESQLLLKNGDTTTLSEQQLVDCSNNYGCAGGDQYPTFQWIQQNGLTTEAAYPYTARDGSCKSVTNVVSTLSSVERVKADENSLAEAIASIGPISVSADATLWSFYGGGIFDDEDCDNELNHAILGVGYGSDHWIIKNSWGEDWGENGYMRLGRGNNRCGIADDNSYALL